MCVSVSDLTHLFLTPSLGLSLYLLRKTVALTIEVWRLFMGQRLFIIYYIVYPCIRRSALPNTYTIRAAAGAGAVD